MSRFLLLLDQETHVRSCKTEIHEYFRAISEENCDLLTKKKENYDFGISDRSNLDG